MTENKFLQWATMLVPTAIVIIMAIITFSNHTTTVSVTTFEKIIQMEKEVETLRVDIDKLEEKKVDKDTFQMLIDRLDRIDNNIDKIKNKT